MRALVFEAVRDVRVATVPDPVLTAPGEVIVRVRHAAVCGSDLHVYRGHETGIDAGTPMGHEMVGEVVEAGSAVARFRPGDLVVAPFTTCCGACFYCRTGLPARCVHGQLFGWVEQGKGLPGVQAEYVRVPLADSTLVAVPEGTPAGQLALFAGDILATGWFAAESAGAGPGAVVAIVGGGPVGLMAAIAAREFGAERIFAVDFAAERRHLAERFGATGLAPGAEAIEAVREATEGRGADAVVEAVGSPEATRLAFGFVRPGGTLAAVGVHTEGALAFRPGEAYDKNLTYRAGRAPARRYMERLLPLLGAGRYDFAALISHRLPLAEAARGYDLFDRRLEGCTKVLLSPG